MFYDAGYRASPNATGRMFCGRLLISPHPVAAHHSTSSSATLNSRPHRYSRGSPRPEVQGLCHSRGHLPRRRKWPAVHQTKNSWRHWAARSHQHRGTSPGRLWRTPSPLESHFSLAFSRIAGRPIQWLDPWLQAEIQSSRRVRRPAARASHFEVSLRFRLRTPGSRRITQEKESRT